MRATPARAVPGNMNSETGCAAVGGQHVGDAAVRGQAAAGADEREAIGGGTRRNVQPPPVVGFELARDSGGVRPGHARLEQREALHVVERQFRRQHRRRVRDDANTKRPGKAEHHQAGRREGHRAPTGPHPRRSPFDVGASAVQRCRRASGAVTESDAAFSITTRRAVASAAARRAHGWHSREMGIHGLPVCRLGLRIEGYAASSTGRRPDNSPSSPSTEIPAAVSRS